MDQVCPAARDGGRWNKGDAVGAYARRRRADDVAGHWARGGAPVARGGDPGAGRKDHEGGE